MANAKANANPKAIIALILAMFVIVADADAAAEIEMPLSLNKNENIYRWMWNAAQWDANKTNDNENAYKLDATAGVQSGSSLGENLFYVEVGVGSPNAQKKALAIDMGGSLSWLQCQSRSPSQKVLTCADAACKAAVDNTCKGKAPTSPCTFSIGNLAAGQITTDTLTFGNQAVSNVVLGCSTKKPFKSVISGQVGLGLGASNLARSKEFGGKFSFRLPRFLSEEKGSLCFGPTCGGGGANAVTTKISPFGSSETYTVPLVGISVGGQRLAINPGTRKGQTSTIVDTSVMFGRLHPSLFEAFKSAFVKGVSPSVKPAPASSGMQTCFKVDAANSDSVKGLFPAVVLHFPSGNVPLNPASLLVPLSPTQACMSFVSANAKQEDVHTLGAFQLQNLNLAFDLNTQSLTITP